MIEAKVDKSCTEIRCAGDLRVLCAEVGEILRDIHRQLLASQPGAAKEFRQMITLMAAAPDSPLWKAENLPRGARSTCICHDAKEPVTVDMLQQMIRAGASADMIGECLKDRG